MLQGKIIISSQKMYTAMEWPVMVYESELCADIKTTKHSWLGFIGQNSWDNHIDIYIGENVDG